MGIHRGGEGSVRNQVILKIIRVSGQKGGGVKEGDGSLRGENISAYQRKGTKTRGDEIHKGKWGLPKGESLSKKKPGGG